MSRRTVFDKTVKPTKSKLWIKKSETQVLRLDNWYTGKEFNALHPGPFYKIIHSSCKSFQFKYQMDSINTDSFNKTYHTNPADSDLLHTDKGDVVGLHFSDLKHLAYWIRYYLHDSNTDPVNFLQIAQVEIPSDSIVMVLSNRYKASKIYIGSPVKIQDFLANADLTDQNGIAYDHISLMHVFTMLASTSQNSPNILSKILSIQAITDKLKVEPYFNLRYFASMILIRSDNIEAIRIFVEHGVQIVDHRSSCILFSAISYNRIGVVRWILNQLDDIDVVICNRALLIASSKGHSSISIKQMLLAKHTKS